MSEQNQGRLSFVVGFFSGLAAAYTVNFVYSNDKGAELRAKFSQHWQETKNCCSKIKNDLSSPPQKTKKVAKKRGAKLGSKKTKKPIKKFRGV